MTKFKFEPETFRRRLQEARIEADMTQKQLAKRCGVSSAQISYWERGVASPNAENLARICFELDASPDWLLGLAIYPHKP